MKLVLAEMRRNRGRFGAIVGTMVLIVFLVVVLTGLADGLYYGSTGALRTSGADLYVFSMSGRQQLARSMLPAAGASQVASVPGVAEVGAIGVLQGTAQGPDGTIDVALMGYVPGRPGGPARAVEGRIPTAGESDTAAADVALKDRGVDVGDVITFSGTTKPLEVVGFTPDSRYQLQPTLWTTVDTWRAIRNEARPELAGRTDDVQAFAVALESGASASRTAEEIDDALAGDTETITRADALLALPGVKQQRSTFDQIIGTTFLVAAIVIALFFALVTLEKRNQLAVLKAIGASSRYLAAGILVQSLVIGGVSVVLGIALSQAVALVLPAEVPVTFRGSAALTVALLTLATAALGAAFSFRRVTRIDPAAALGGT